MSRAKLEVVVGFVDELIEAEHREALDLLEIYIEHRNCAEAHRVCDDFNEQYESEDIAELALDRLKSQLT